MSYIQLPKSDKEVGPIVREMLQRGKIERAPKHVPWQVLYWYLQGVRGFNVQSYKTGRVVAAYEAPEGQLKYTHEEIVTLFQAELGRRMRMDTLPRVKAGTVGLDRIRQAATGQVYLDECASHQKHEQLKMTMLRGLLRYGTMGQQVAPVRVKTGKLAAIIQPVYPWEIIPLPVNPSESSEVHGYIRHRWVPLRWLKEQEGLKFGRDREQSLQSRDVEYGGRISNFEEAAATATMMLGLGTNPSQRKDIPGDERPHTEEQVELLELWIEGELERVVRHVVMAGDQVLMNLSFEDRDIRERPPAAFSVCRDFDVAGFWGRSFCEMILPLNREEELMLSNLFKNVQEFDQLGLTLIPRTWDVRRHQLQGSTKPAMFTYEPDYAMRAAGLERIQPVNSGDMPGRVYASASQLKEKMAGSSPLMRGDSPGRVDSASGLGLLYETGNIPTIPAATSLAECYARSYAAILHAGRALYTEGGMSLQTSAIDDAVAGVAVDATGKVMLDSGELLPDPVDVKIDIRERDPILLEKRRQEVLQMLQLQQISPDEFAWMNYKEQLGFPLGTKQVVEEYRKANFRNIVQFNDGKTPNEVVTSSYDNHKVQRDLILAFMARVEFELAEPPVKNKFAERLAYHENALGMPSMGTPPPDALGGGLPWGQNLPPELQSMQGTPSPMGGGGPMPGGPPGMM